MTERERPTVVGVFEDRSQAERTVGELRRAGFREDQIGFLVREGATGASLEGCDTNTKAEEGMTAGLLAGGAAGALLGAIAAPLIPGVGLTVAAGVFAGALGGAAVGGVAGTLVGMGIPEDEARMYECELTAGRTLVTVRADARATEAVAILRREGAYDASKAGDLTAGGAAGLA